VAVIRPTVTDAELKMLDDGGIRGIRFSLTDPRNSPTSIEMIEPLSKRVNTLGWNRLPSTMVFDHMGHVIAGMSLSFPASRCDDATRARYIVLMREAAAVVSAQLGAPDHPA